MIYLVKYFSKYKVPYFLALMFLTIEAIADLLQPTIMSHIVDEGVKHKDLEYVLTASLLMLLVTAIGAVSAMSRNYLASTVSQRFSCDLRLDVYTKVQKLSFESIDEIEQGSLITRLTNDITQIQNFSYGIMRIFVKAPITTIGAVIMMFLLDKTMALILLIIIPMAFLLIFISMKVGFPFFLKVQLVLDRLNTTMREYLSGVRVVKAFNRFKYEEERFSKVNQDLADTTIKTMRVLSFFTPGIFLTVNLGIVVILFIGGDRVLAGDLEVGKLMAFVLYMTQILHSLSLIANIFNMFVRANASSLRISEIMNGKEAPSNPDSIIEGEQVSSLSFNQVDFSYQGTSGKVLKNITFNCSSGETIGIIGSTGSGKTTLLHLLMRFYDVSDGEILINGKNIKEYKVTNLRKMIGMVPQKNILFTGSILDNVLFGNEEASIDDVKYATSIACIHDFVEQLKEGYDTVLGQGGVNLSGGQKQRLCIARGIVRAPNILILDDCTSAVDVTTESEIKKGLKAYSSDLISFIVSQRISSIIDCDKILVLENGEIIGQGTHVDLIEKCDVYKDIYRSQIGKVGELNG